MIKIVCVCTINKKIPVLFRRRVVYIGKIPMGYGNFADARSRANSPCFAARQESRCAHGESSGQLASLRPRTLPVRRPVMNGPDNVLQWSGNESEALGLHPSDGMASGMSPAISIGMPAAVVEPGAESRPGKPPSGATEPVGSAGDGAHTGDPGRASASVHELDQIRRAHEEAMTQLEHRIEERTRDLQATNDTLGREVEQRHLLEKRLMAMLETERRELGQDLHDNIASQLSGIELFCEATLRKRSRSTARKGLRTIARLVRNALGDTRRIAHSMAPVPSSPHGLALSLRVLAQYTRMTTECQCTLRNHGAQIADPSVALHLYRIAQEASANAARHGAARRIAIVLKSTTAGVRLLIRDDGCGITEELPDHIGIGIATMKIRANAIGGSLLVCRNDAGGTDVICTVPHAPTAAAVPHGD